MPATIPSRGYVGTPASAHKLAAKALIKQLRNDDRVARQAVSRKHRSDDGGEYVSRGHPKQGGECGILDKTAQHGRVYGRKRGDGV